MTNCRYRFDIKGTPMFSSRWWMLNIIRYLCMCSRISFSFRHGPTVFDYENMLGVEYIGDLHLNSGYSYIYVMWSKIGFIWYILLVKVYQSLLKNETLWVENFHSISMSLFPFRYLWSGISMVFDVRYLWHREVDHSWNIYFLIFPNTHVRSLCHRISMIMFLRYLCVCLGPK